MAVQPLAVTGVGFDSKRSVTIDLSAFRDSIRMVFSGSLFMLTPVILVGLSALRMFLNLHYKTLLSSLVDSINAFSDDPSVASPIAEELRDYRNSPQPRGPLNPCSATRFWRCASASGLPISVRRLRRSITTSAIC